MSLFVKQGGSFPKVTGYHIKQGGVWKPIKEAFVKEGGVWKKYWPESTVVVPPEGIFPGNIRKFPSGIYTNPNIGFVPLTNTNGGWPDTPAYGIGGGGWCWFDTTEDWYGLHPQSPGPSPQLAFMDFNGGAHIDTEGDLARIQGIVFYSDTGVEIDRFSRAQIFSQKFWVADLGSWGYLIPATKYYTKDGTPNGPRIYGHSDWYYI